MTDSIVAVAHRLKRLTTNRDVLALCEYVLAGQTTATTEVLPVAQGVGGAPAAPKPGFDRRSYMRDYMRKQRAKAG